MASECVGHTDVNLCSLKKIVSLSKGESRDNLYSINLRNRV